MSHRDFANIAVGDTVIVHSNRGRTLHKIAKVTKTQFAVESGTRFLRSDGGEYGRDHYSGTWCTIPDADDIAAVHVEQRQVRAIAVAYRLRNEIDVALSMISSRGAQGWGPTIEASNDHLRRALEALQVKQEEPA